MYNAERKEQYLRERKAEAEIAFNTESGFNIAESFETTYNRDLAEWTSTEIVKFFKFYGTAKIQTLINLKNSFQIYTDWCIINGLVGDNQNHYTELSTEDLLKCIDLHKLQSEIVSRDVLLKELQKLPNYSDRYIFLGLFEGISSKGCMIGKIRFDQVEPEKIVYDNGDELAISPQLYSIIKTAEMETERVFNGNSNRREVYLPSNTIIRQTIKKNPQNNLSLLIGGRFRSGLKQMDLPQTITQKSIAESGRIEFIRNMMKQYNISKKEIFNDEYRQIHEKIFGRVQNITTYMETYGKFI